MQKASFEKVQEELHNIVSQLLDYTLIINKVSLHSQHSKGSTKIIADSLSIYFHISDNSLTKRFEPILSRQTAVSLHIKPLLRDIISWILSLAQYLTKPT